MGSITLSIVIVNYNGESLLDPLFDSIFASEVSFEYEVIVIDNASSDRSVDILESYRDRITLILNTDNVGFSCGNNQGFKVATGEYVLMLNNDTVVYPDAFEQMVSYMRAHPKVGGLAPKLLNTDGSLQAPGSVFGAWRFYAKSPRKVPFLIGAAFLAPRSLMDDIGGLDENLFFYNDDIDLCRKIMAAGYELIYYPLVSIIHHGGFSAKTRHADAIVDGYRGGLYLCYHYYPRLVYHAYRLVLMVDVVPKMIFHGIRGLFRSKARAFFKAYVAIVRITWLQDFARRSS